MNPADPHSSRRRFFREGLARMVGPLADYLGDRLRLPAPRIHLRPPGAIREDAFNDTCYRCGTCVGVCPAKAIVALHDPADAAHGTPIIDPDLAACTLCETVACTANCPSGALLPVLDRYSVRMGTAIVHPAVCVRSQGEKCTHCTDACPIGVTAIQTPDSGPPRILANGCTGCGQCQLHCPTTPKAITIKPR